MSLQISLTDSGDLQIDWFAANGKACSIPLRWTGSINPARTIEQILIAQQRGDVGLGKTGEPTRQQLMHMERHQVFRDTKCPFCRHEELREALLASAEGDEERKPYSHANDARYAWRSQGDVKVRRIALGDTGKKERGRAKTIATKEATKIRKAEELKRLSVATKGKTSSLGF